MPPYYFIADAHLNLRDVFDSSKGDPIAHAVEWWSRHGLASVIAHHGGRISCSHVQSGPGNQSGVWLTVWPEHGEAPQPLGFHPSKQTWKQVRRNLWIGWTTDHPPGPDDLSNGDPYDVRGPQLKLCDGNSWTVAEVREPVSYGQLFPTAAQRTHLPTLVKRDLDGNPIRPVKPEFEKLWELSGDWFDVWCEICFSDRNTFDSDTALEFVLQVMQLRYRLPVVLNDALGLIDTSNLQKMIEAAIGWPTVRKLLEERAGLVEQSAKKNEAAPSDTLNGSSGPEASDLSTALPEANNGQPPTAAGDGVGGLGDVDRNTAEQAKQEGGEPCQT